MNAFYHTDILSHIYSFLDFPQTCRFALVRQSSALCLAQERMVYTNTHGRSSFTCLFTDWCNQMRQTVSRMIEKKCSMDSRHQPYSWESLIRYEDTLETEIRYAVTKGVCSLPTEWWSLQQYVHHKAIYYTDIVRQAEYQYPLFYCMQCDAMSHPTFDVCAVQHFLKDVHHLVNNWLDQHQYNQVCLSCFLKLHNIRTEQIQRKRSRLTAFEKCSE